MHVLFALIPLRSLVSLFAPTFKMLDLRLGTVSRLQNKYNALHGDIGSVIQYRVFISTGKVLLMRTSRKGKMKVGLMLSGERYSTPTSD